MSLSLRRKEIAKVAILGRKKAKINPMIQAEWTRLLGRRIEKVDVPTPVRISSSGFMFSLSGDEIASRKAYPEVFAHRVQGSQFNWHGALGTPISNPGSFYIAVHGPTPITATTRAVNEVVLPEPEDLESYTDALPIVMDFAPSTKLAKYWLDGILYYAGLDQSGVLDHSNFTSSDLSTVKTELAQMVYEIVVEELRTRRGAEPTKVNLVNDEKNLDALLEYKISESFAVRPRDLGDFIRGLTEELAEYFASHSNWEGKWGRVYGSKGMVWAHLTRRETLKFDARTSTSMDIRL